MTGDSHQGNPTQMKPHTLTPYPMTPPDDPPEPPLDDALPCVCGYMPTWEFKPWNQCRLRCDVNCAEGGWADNADKAIEYWNQAVMERGDNESEARKAAGIEAVTCNNGAWMDIVLAEIIAFATTGREFTIEDIRNSCMDYQPKHPNAWGAAFSTAAKQGLIVRCGYTKNHLASAHARVVAVWKGAK